jgi:CRISPR/Cas system-associated exonuclease Cas4 (RecB family)
MKKGLLLLSSIAMLATSSVAYEVTESEREFINKYREAKLKEAMKPKVSVQRQVVMPRTAVMPRNPVLIKNAQGVHVPVNVHQGQPMQQQPMMQQQRRVQAPVQRQQARPIQMPMPRRMVAKSDVNYDINKIFAEDFPVTYRKKVCKNCSY